MNRIRELRLDRGLSQEDLGELVGKSNHSIGKWEKEITEPSTADIDLLCDILGATSDYLFCRTNYNTRRIELDVEQLPQNLRDAGLRHVSMLREYVDANGGILPEIQRELLRLIAEAKLLEPREKAPEKPSRFRKPM